MQVMSPPIIGIFNIFSCKSISYFAVAPSSTCLLNALLWRFSCYIHMCGSCTFALKWTKRKKSWIAARVQMWLKRLHANQIPVRWVAQCWVRWLKPISLRCFAPKLWPRDRFSSFYVQFISHSAVSQISWYSKRGVQRKEKTYLAACDLKRLEDSTISSNKCAEREKRNHEPKKNGNSCRAGQAVSEWAGSALMWE